MRTLRQCLVDVEIPHLRAIAQFWDVDGAEGSRRDQVARLIAAMIAGEAFVSAVAALPADERGALVALQEAGGALPIKVFGRQWGMIRTMGPARMRREKPWRAAQSPAEGLWYKGLVFTEFQLTPTGSYEVAFIPEEFFALLPDIPGDEQPVSPPLPRVQLDPPPSSGAMLDDVCTLLAYVQNHTVRDGGRGRWRDADAPAAASLLHVREPDYLRLLQTLTWDLKWVEPAPKGRLRLVWDPVEAWLQAPGSAQREVLADAWLDCMAYDELAQIPSLELPDQGTGRRDVRSARRAVLRQLAACPGAAWHTVDEFIDEIRRADPDFQRPSGDYDSWYIRDRQSGEFLTGFESWDAVEGRLIRYLLARPLAWLGIVAFDPKGAEAGRPAVRLTDGGLALLGRAEPRPAGAAEPLSVRADFTVRVPSERRFERFQLARVANCVSAGDTYTYRISPSSLRRAAENGIGVDRVVDFLLRSSQRPVPRVVLDALTSWDARGSEAALVHVGLLTVPREEIMTQIVQSPASSRYIVERVGPAAAIVRPRDWARLIEELGKLAILPEVGASLARAPGGRHGDAWSGSGAES